MRRSLWATMVVLLATGIFLVAGCGGDDDNGNPTGNNGGGSTFSADIDGVSFTASYGASATKQEIQGFPTYVNVGGFGPYAGDTCLFALTFEDPTTGTFDMGSGIIDYVGGLTLAQANEDYATINGDGNGTVTIGTYNASKITGTFSFVAYTNDGQDSVVVTNGVFNLSIMTL